MGSIERNPRLPAIDYDRVMSLVRDETFEWDERDVMLYALGVGMADDPLDEKELPFVYERELKVFPTFAAVVACLGGPQEDIGTDPRYILHGEHSMTLFQPLPVRGKLHARGRITGAWDNGVGKGAVFSQEKLLFLEGESRPTACIVTTNFARADGGFGGPPSSRPKPHRVPDRAPDKVVEISTQQKQALLYRLSGDLNPLHAEPAAARAAGFPRPILHGLCTYALCCRAVLAEYCDNDPARIREHQVRFSAPVFPGETLSVDLWRDGNTVSFEASVKSRGVVVIRHGRTIVS